MKPSKTLGPAARKVKLPSWLQDPRLSYIMSQIKEAKLVGGVVRNILLGKEKTDIDIASPTHPKTLISLLKKTAIKSIPTGIQYGTITLLYEGLEVEHTTLREDIKSRNNRHPIVAYTDSFLKDAKRRDFTINALYADLEGNIYDPLGESLKDISPPIIRFIGNAEKRIEEDTLRILRFFRFMAEYAPILEDKKGLEATIKAKEKLKKLSQERIRKEFFKLLQAQFAPKILKKMLQTTILEPILPDFQNHALFEKLHKKILASHFENKELKIILLLACLASKTTPNLCYLSLSKIEKDFLKFCLDPPLIRSIEEALYLYGKDKTQALMLLNRLPYRIEKIQNWRAPMFPLNGKMLLQKGFKSGKPLGEALLKTELWWVQKKFTPDKDACLNYFKSKLN